MQQKKKKNHTKRNVPFKQRYKGFGQLFFVADIFKATLIFPVKQVSIKEQQ